jgi:ketosteroid isomerase-like protein
MTNRDAEIAANVRRGLDAYSRQDFDTVMTFVHPEIELVLSGEQQPLKGAAQFRAWMEPDAFESQEVEPLDIRVVGNKALVRQRNHIRGAGSGLEADFLNWSVRTYDDAGLLTRIAIFTDHQEAEALEAVGLKEQAMSKENAEIVQRAYKLLNQGDIEGLVSLCRDDFVMDMSERVFNPETYRGHEGIRQFHRDVQEAWETYEWHVEEARTTGDSVVAMLYCHGTSREGGPQVDWRVAWIWNFDRGKATSLRFYRERQEALEAVGLSE